MRRTSLAPAGFLISRIETGVPLDLDRLDPAEGGAHVGEGGRRPLRVDAELERGGERGEGVVDVVEAGEGQLERRARPAGVRTATVEPLMPCSSISVAATSGRGREAPQLAQE